MPRRRALAPVTFALPRCAPERREVDLRRRGSRSLVVSASETSIEDTTMPVRQGGRIETRSADASLPPVKLTRLCAF
jgi:hypothetical protein